MLIESHLTLIGQEEYIVYVVVLPTIWIDGVTYREKRRLARDTFSLHLGLRSHHFDIQGSLYHRGASCSGEVTFIVIT